MDPIICTFDEFVDHIKNRLKDVSLQVEYNDHLYSEEEYPKLKALVVDAGSYFCFSNNSEQNGA